MTAILHPTMGNSLSPRYRTTTEEELAAVDWIPPSPDLPPIYSGKGQTYGQIAYNTLLVICRAYVRDKSFSEANIVTAFKAKYGESTGVHHAPGLAHTFIQCHESDVKFPYERFVFEPLNLKE